MKVKLFFVIPFVIALSGCGSEEADVSTDVVPEQAATSIAQNDADNLEKLINPAPILALSQVGNVNNTPQFIRSQKVEQAFKNGRPHRELTIHLSLIHI